MQEELDTEWYSQCCSAGPVFPGIVDDSCTAFCNECKDGSGFERQVAQFPGYPTTGGGVDFILIQNWDGFFVGQYGTDDGGDDIYPDDDTRMSWEDFKKNLNDDELLKKMEEAIEEAKRSH